MKCIFCKNNTDDCKSKEHVIPESLGNTDYFLEKGWVCDKCNNYLSRKVEAPFLNSEYGKRSRFEMMVQSKRGRIPVVTGIHPGSRTSVDFIYDGEMLSFCASDLKHEANFIKNLQSHSHGSLYIPAAGNPSHSYETSRFIGMVALEVLAHKFKNIDDWNEEIVQKTELDELRNYVRYGKMRYVWPIHIRRIYPADQEFLETEMPQHQVLHEWDILFIPESGASLVVSITLLLLCLA